MVEDLLCFSFRSFVYFNHVFGDLGLKYLINSFFVFCFSLLGQSDQKLKIRSPVYLLLTEKVNFFLVNKEKKISVKTGFEELNFPPISVKFVFSKKATKIEEFFTVDLTV